MLSAALALVLSASLAPDAQRSTLANGMTLILAEDHRVPGVAVLLTYNVGSRDEAPGHTGFAHLFEHLMFMGSAHLPYPGYDTLMEGVGGQNNADTSNDRTRYFEWGPSNLLETFLYEEADRLQTLPDTMTDAKVQAQLRVVLNERREDYDNRPYGRTEVEVAEHLFPPEHPYHWPVLGYQPDLEAASTADVTAFFRRFYTPSNAVLCIVGDFDATAARALVEKWFGWMPAQPVVRALAPPQPILPKAVDEELTEKVELPKAVLAWHSPAEGTAGDAAAELLAEILAGTRSSRLHRALVYEQRVAQEVLAEQQSLQLGSIFQIELLASPGHSAQENIAAADAELAKLAESGPTLAELDAAKLDARTTLARSLEPLVGRAVVLDRLQRDFGDPNALDREQARIASQTVESVRDAARALRNQPRFTLTFKPLPQAEAK